jgi:aryl-alcohol dehydrogenase-like predicted oxidoreductase
VACVRAALEAGITTFDTADVYAMGAGESILGRALRSVPRESVVLCTKVFFPTGPGPNDRGLSRKHILEACHSSLRRLGTDYVDLYQAHRFDSSVPLEETLRAFDDLIRQGKVLHMGVSEWRSEQIAGAVKLLESTGGDRIVSNQAEYSAIWRVIEPEVLPLCLAEGIGQLAYSPLAQGVLAGRYLPGEPPPPGSRATESEAAPFIGRVMRDELLERVQRLAPLAADMGMSLAQLGLAWVLSNPGVSAAIIGGSRPEQVRENAQASGRTLPPETMAGIEAILGPEIVSDPSRTRSPRAAS